MPGPCSGYWPQRAPLPCLPGTPTPDDVAMKGLDHLLSRPSQLAVLRVLHYAESPLSGRDVERRTGLANRTVMGALTALVDLRAVHCEAGAHSHQFRINRAHYFVARAMRLAFEAEDLFWDDLRKTVRRIVVPRPLAAVATGRIVREERLTGGTLEVTLLFSSGRNRISAYRCWEELAEVVADRYSIRLETNWLDVNIMDRAEFDTLWRRVEREGMLLFGRLP